MFIYFCFDAFSYFFFFFVGCSIVQTNNRNENFPLPYEMSTMWKSVDIVGYVNANASLTDDINKYLQSAGKTADAGKDLALYLASSSYYQCVQQQTCNAASYETKDALDTQLNNAPAPTPGVLLRFNKPNAVYYYICSRNNNFSNRSQKGSIAVN